MIKVRIKKNRSQVNEDTEDVENHLYELHKEIREMEGKKLKLQQELKYLSEKIKSMHRQTKPISIDKILKFCNNINATAKGQLGKK